MEIVSFNGNLLKKILKAGTVLFLAGSVAGCGASSTENTVEIVEHTLAMQTSKGNSEYETKLQIPGIFVDQVGYNKTADKSIVFAAKELPSEFSIVDLESKEVAYTGEIIKPYFDENSGKYYGIGRFNEFEDEGNYYIYAENIGESYSFEISGDIYERSFPKAFNKFYINRCGIAVSENVAGENGHSACHTVEAKLQENPETLLDVTGGWHMDEQADRDSLLGCKIVDNLLLAYEMNPTSFKDDTSIPESGNEIPDIIDEVKYEVDWLLKMQDSKTGGVYGAALTGEGAGDIFSAPVIVTGVSMDATIYFAAAMARFSFIYQQYDGDYATTVLRAADRAFECFLNNQKATDNTAAYNAASQLYRATGNSKYSDVLNKFFAVEGFDELFNTDENIFLGSVTYLSTSQPVNKDRCDILIKDLMKRAENIAKRASESSFLVADMAGDDFTAFLDDVRCLIVTNHIIYSHEYKTIIENHIHYAMGMNPLGINYVTDNTENNYVDRNVNGLMNNPLTDALLIFMISAVF